MMFLYINLIKIIHYFDQKHCLKKFYQIENKMDGIPKKQIKPFAGETWTRRVKIHQ